MLKHFKVTLILLMATVSCFDAVAQANDFKDVLLNDKPAKLNVNTGEVTLTDTVASKSKTSKNKLADNKVLDSVYFIPPKLHKSVNAKSENVIEVLSKPEKDDVTDSDFHIVKKNETLYALSKKYQTTIGQLKLVNNLNTTLIKINQKLRVKNFDSLDSNDISVWTVAKGDTLYSIAKRNNTSVEKIKALNGLQSNLIKPGQKLRLQ
ncbi:LysM peptidoglycan-binding domain-containing protein [uncultured Psychroserpens sp.]|uniref:LysM peptidoglycan-binding domain-containing protein n=1 Tax=uncultured Psychroserpens sp. TaxID=255436 RepID=UPI00263343B8|nr:LysM peptidoglycan-binding domain-containing protein [uncultured Psychroserpens sp.]